MNEIFEIIQEARKRGASDIHISQGLPMLFRINGSLGEAGGAMDEGKTRQVILSMLSLEQKGLLEGGEDLDFAVETPDGNRQRVNVFCQQKKYAATIRLLNNQIPTLEELQLPKVLRELAGKLSLSHQREVGCDAQSFATALRSSLREDPDVILVGEMRDYETISAALTAAETGHLVLSTLHTTGAAQTIDRIIDACPGAAQNQVRTQLSGILAGVVTQCLIPRMDGSGRIAATEILVGTDAALNLIRENKCHQMNTIMQSGASVGMHSLNADLANLVRKKVISSSSAFKYSNDRKDLEQYLTF